MKNGDYKDTVKEQPGSASVVQGVTEDRYGIGYSGIGYKTSGVKSGAAGGAAEGPFSNGSYEDVTDGQVSVGRFLYIYVNKAPGKSLDPVPLEFVKLMLSKEGQEAVVKDGYMPLTPAQVKEEHAKNRGRSDDQLTVEGRAPARRPPARTDRVPAEALR